MQFKKNKSLKHYLDRLTTSPFSAIDTSPF